MAQFAPHGLPKFQCSPNKSYYCEKCCRILRPPVLQSYCGHRFCSLCVSTMLDPPDVVNCPANMHDCVSLRKQEFYPDVAVSKELKRMVVWCRFHGEGCDVRKEWGNIANHEHTCQKNNLPRDALTCPIQKSLVRIDSNVGDIRRNQQNISHRVDENMATMENHVTNIGSEVKSQQEEINEIKTTVNMLKRQNQLLVHIVKHQRSKNFHYAGERWKITNYRKCKDQAIQDISPFVESKPFYTGVPGYKLCVRFYPNGYGDGKGSHVSLSFALQNGEYDTVIPWPFAKTVTFTLLEQRENGKSVVAAYNCNPFNPTWRRQTSTKTSAWAGITQFVNHETIEKGEFLRNDSLVLIIKVKNTAYRSWVREIANQ